MLTEGGRSLKGKQKDSLLVNRGTSKEPYNNQGTKRMKLVNKDKMKKMNRMKMAMAAAAQVGRHKSETELPMKPLAKTQLTSKKRSIMIQTMGRRGQQMTKNHSI